MSMLASIGSKMIIHVIPMFFFDIKFKTEGLQSFQPGLLELSFLENFPLVDNPSPQSDSTVWYSEVTVFFLEDERRSNRLSAAHAEKEKAREMVLFFSHCRCWSRDIDAVAIFVLSLR